MSSAACAPYDPQAVPLSRLTQLIDQLTVRVSECQRNAPWLAALGHLLNRQQRYSEAADHLERALMLEPGLQAAELDYSLALAGQGDIQTAIAIVQDLLASNTLPEALRTVLQRQLVVWAEPSSGLERLVGTATPGAPLSPWQWGGVASVRLGVDSNLLAAPDLQTLTLTFAGQSQTLPLDEGYRPQSGGYQQADLQLLLRRAPTTELGPTWEFAVGLRSRTSAAAAAGAAQYDLTAERTTYRRQISTVPTTQHGSYLNAAVYGLNNQTGTQIQLRGLGAGWGYLRAAVHQQCEGRLGPELQDRSYASNPMLSGNYFGLGASWGCNPSQSQVQTASRLPNLGNQWQISFKVGRDAARQAGRAGGDQTQAALRLLLRVPAAALVPGLLSSLLADAEVSASQDSGPYSPLLESGAPRSLRRTIMRLEYQHPLPKISGLSTQWVFGLDWAQQQSNLPLFGLQSRGIYSTARLAW